MAHRYQIGARVRINPSLSHRDASRETYEVKRQLPSSSDGEYQYRIKCAREDHERVAKESDLERA